MFKTIQRKNVPTKFLMTLFSPLQIPILQFLVPDRILAPNKNLKPHPIQLHTQLLNTAQRKMRGKRSKQYRKLMQQYGLSFGFREPYQVLGMLHLDI